MKARQRQRRSIEQDGQVQGAESPGTISRERRYSRCWNEPCSRTNLFVISSVTRRPIGGIVHELLPFYVVMIVALIIIITYVPFISLWLPRAAGLLL